MLDTSLAPDPAYSRHVLFIHEDVRGAEYGNIGTVSKVELSVEVFKDWDIVFNGHIHKPQTYDNIVMIGSPIITDWGEAGEEKRFLHFKDGEIHSIAINCPKFITLPGLSERIKKSLMQNSRDFFRVEISSEELSDPIFKRYNIFPYITKTSKRELRLKDNDSIEDDIDQYLSITKTKLDKEIIKSVGLEIIHV